MKSQWLDHHLQANVAAFYSKYDGIQLNVQEGPSPVYQNAGNATIKGLELELASVFDNGFGLNFTAGYMDAYYTFLNPCLLYNNCDPAQGAQYIPGFGGFSYHSELPKTPKTKFSVSPTYDFHLANNAVMRVEADYTYVAHMFNDGPEHGAAGERFDEYGQRGNPLHSAGPEIRVHRGRHQLDRRPLPDRGFGQLHRRRNCGFLQPAADVVFDDPGPLAVRQGTVPGATRADREYLIGVLTPAQRRGGVLLPFDQALRGHHHGNRTVSNAIGRFICSTRLPTAAAKRVLARKPALFINNEWVSSTHDATIAVEDPSVGREIARIVDASKADVDRAVGAARAAFDDGRWSNLPPNKRERIINKLADLIEAHAAEFAELEAIDNGKPIGMASAVEVPGAVDMLRYMAGWASKLGGELIEPQGVPRGTVLSYVSREPVGVAVQIIPWNFPLLMAALKIAPALTVGCTVILKPAEQTSMTALRLADLVAEAGFPPGVVNVITGNGHTTGDFLVKHPDVDKIAFTGSTEVGKLINRNATDSLKRVTLELGGKSPVVVMPDVNVDEVAAAAAGAIFFNAGQVCIAGSRLFAHRSIFDRVIEGVATRVGVLEAAPVARPARTHGPAGVEGADGPCHGVHRGG